MINIYDEHNLFVGNTEKEDKLFNIINVEFEIKNIDRLIDIKEPKQVVERIREKRGLESSKKVIYPSDDETVGTFLLEILNDYNNIQKNVLCEYMKLYHKLKKIGIAKDTVLRNKFKCNTDEYTKEREKLEQRLFNICYSTFDKLLTKVKQLHPKLSIFELSSLDHMHKIYNDYKKNIKQLKEDLIKLNKAKLHTPKEKTRLYEGLCETIKETEEKIQERDNIDYMLQQLVIPVAQYVTEWSSCKQLINDTFIHSDETRNNKFSGIYSFLPDSKIEYKSDNVKYPIPFKYTYRIRYIEDFISITLYQLILNHKVIIKCKNCGKYRIPNRTDQVFCDTKCKDNYADKNRSFGKDNEKVNIYYAKLRKRYNNNPIYHKELEEIKKLYQDCKSRQLDDKETMKILTDFENKVNSTYKVKRGRPKKK